MLLKVCPLPPFIFFGTSHEVELLFEMYIIYDHSQRNFGHPFLVPCTCRNKTKTQAIIIHWKCADVCYEFCRTYFCMKYFWHIKSTEICSTEFITHISTFPVSRKINCVQQENNHQNEPRPAKACLNTGWYTEFLNILSFFCFRSFATLMINKVRSFRCPGYVCQKWSRLPELKLAKFLNQSKVDKRFRNSVYQMCVKA